MLMMLMVVVPAGRMVRVSVMCMCKRRRRRHAVLRIISGNVQRLPKEQLPQKQMQWSTALAAVIIDGAHFDFSNE
jgi:hypothetical protein